MSTDHPDNSLLRAYAHLEIEDEAELVDGPTAAARPLWPYLTSAAAVVLVLVLFVWIFNRDKRARLLADTPRYFQVDALLGGGDTDWQTAYRSEDWSRTIALLAPVLDSAARQVPNWAGSSTELRRQALALGSACLRTRDYQAAIRWLEPLRDQRDSEEDALWAVWLLGHAYYLSGQEQPAVEAWERLARQDNLPELRDAARQLLDADERSDK
ncbi:MAG: hypothetical protein OHK0039_38240 [Bacteroidia bacterium]